MRFVAALFLWLATTLSLAVAIPAAWVQTNIVDADGYAAIARNAAEDPVLQSAMAAELITRATSLIAERSGRRYPVDSSRVREAATAFTASRSFPPLFVQANRSAHRWLFGEPRSGHNGEQWVVDLSPMLKDGSLQRMLSSYNVKVPETLKAPLTASAPSMDGPIRQGQLRSLVVWGPWVSIGAIGVSCVCGLLTLVAARRRGKALTSLGISALLVGAAGWAGIEVGERYVNNALNRTTGDIRRIADVMVGHAQDSLHLWLNVTLVGGIVLVVLGVLVAMVGSVRR